MEITEINITPVKPADGLIGFASVVVDGNLYISSIAIYTKLDGSYRLLYPTKKVGQRVMNIYHPINRYASQQIERAIFKKCKTIFQGSNDDRYNKDFDTTP